MDRLKEKYPNGWQIKSDGSEFFREKVLTYIETARKGNVLASTWANYENEYYGLNKDVKGINSYKGGCFKEPLITFKDFIELTEKQFITGERVEVSDSKLNWNEGIYIGQDNKDSPIMTVGVFSEDNYKRGDIFKTVRWKYIRKIKKDKLEVKVFMNGKEVSPKIISEETWNN